MPDDAQHGPPDAPVPHRLAHNLYGLGMAEAAQRALLDHAKHQRPFVISRSGFAGIQRHAMVWTGDNHSIWAHLEGGIAMCLGLGLSGVAFVGPDVGGFSGDCTGELLVRWTQAGALTPFFRNHSAQGTRAQEPWAFGPAIEADVKAAIELRYRLLPYLYTCFRDAAQTGLPLMRPMLLDYAAEPVAHTLADQYLFGPDLLVAPVCRPSHRHRTVWFPPGCWHDFHTGAVHEGPGFQVVDAPLRQLPLFVRGGAALPVGPIVQHTGEAVEAIDLWIRPDAHGEVEGSWYDDDGESLQHQAGDYALWRWVGRTRGEAFELIQAAEWDRYQGPARTVRVRFGQAPREATWDGPPVAIAPDGAIALPLASGTLTVRF
jgi:alpha-glucosidase